MITRRSLLRTTALVPLGLAGCAGLIGAIAVAPQVAADVALIASALRVLLPILEAATNLNASARATISSIIDEIAAMSAEVAKASTVDVAKVLIEQLVRGVSTIAALLMGGSFPPIVNAIIADVLALIPAIEAAVGIPVPAPTPAVMGAFAMTPAAARADLQLIVAAKGR
jgi:hypothetical protein